MAMAQSWSSDRSNDLDGVSITSHRVGIGSATYVAWPLIQGSSVMTMWLVSDWDIVQTAKDLLLRSKRS